MQSSDRVQAARGGPLVPDKQLGHTWLVTDLMIIVTIVAAILCVNLLTMSVWGELGMLPLLVAWFAMLRIHPGNLGKTRKQMKL